MGRAAARRDALRRQRHARPGNRRCRTDRRRGAAPDRHRRRRLDRPDGDDRRRRARRDPLLRHRRRKSDRLLVRRGDDLRRQNTRRQALAPGRLPQLRLAGRRFRHAGRSPTRSTRAAARAATAAPTCASPKAPSRGCRAAAATSAPAVPSPASTAAGSRARSRSRPRHAPARLRSWPVSLRAPLTDVAGGAGAATGGARLRRAGGRRRRGGRPLRPRPGLAARVPALLQRRVNKATLRGVAWPEPARAYAVGDRGAMWHVERRPTTSGSRTRACRSASKAT